MTTSNKVEQFYNTLVKDPELDIKPGQTREQAARMEANYRARQYDNNSKALAMATTPDESPINSLFNHLEQMKKSSDDIVLLKVQAAKRIGGYDSKTDYHEDLGTANFYNPKAINLSEIKALGGKKAEIFAKNFNTYFEEIGKTLQGFENQDDIKQLYEQFKNPNPFPFEKPPNKERLKSLRENGYVEGTGKNIKLTARGASHFLSNRQSKNSKSFEVPNSQSNFKLVNLNDDVAFDKVQLKPDTQYNPTLEEKEKYASDLAKKLNISNEQASEWINRGRRGTEGSRNFTQPRTREDYSILMVGLEDFYSDTTKDIKDKPSLSFTEDIRNLYEDYLNATLEDKIDADEWFDDNRSGLKDVGFDLPFESTASGESQVEEEAPKAEGKVEEKTPKAGGKVEEKAPQKTEAELKAEKQSKLKEDLPNSMNTLISEATKYFEKQGGSNQNLSLLNSKIESGTELTQNDFSLFRNTLTNLKGEVGEGSIVGHLRAEHAKDLNNYQASMKPEASADGPLISDEPIDFEQMKEDLKNQRETQAKLNEDELKGAANKAHKKAIDDVLGKEGVKEVIDQMYKDKHGDGDPVITPEKFTERLKSKYYKDETGGIEALENVVSDAFQKNKKVKETSDGDDADNINFINDKFEKHEDDYRHAYEKKYGLDKGDQAEHLKFDNFKDILLNKYKNNKNGFLEETQKYNTEKIKTEKKQATEKKEEEKEEEKQEEGIRLQTKIEANQVDQQRVQEQMKQDANSSIAVDKRMLDWAQNKGEFKGGTNDTKDAATLLLKKHVADYVWLKNQGLLNEETDARYIKTTEALKNLGADTKSITKDLEKLGKEKWGNPDYINAAERKFSGTNDKFFSQRGPAKKIEALSIQLDDLKAVISDEDMEQKNRGKSTAGDAIPVENRGYSTASSPAPEGAIVSRTSSGAMVYDKTKVQKPKTTREEIGEIAGGAVGAAKTGIAASPSVAAKGAKAIKTQVSESVGADVARAAVGAGKAGAKRVSNVRQGKTGSGLRASGTGGIAALPPKTKPERKFTPEDVPSFAGEQGRINPGEDVGPKEAPKGFDRNIQPKRSKRQAFSDLFKADDIENPEGLARWLASKYDGVPTTTKPGEKGWERIQTYLTALKDPAAQHNKGKVNRIREKYTVEDPKTGETTTKTRRIKGKLRGPTRNKETGRKYGGPKSFAQRAKAARDRGVSIHDLATGGFKAPNEASAHRGSYSEAEMKRDKHSGGKKTIADKHLGHKEGYERKFGKRVKRTMEQAKKINKQMPSDELLHKQRQDILERLEKLV